MSEQYPGPAKIGEIVKELFGHGDGLNNDFALSNPALLLDRLAVYENGWAFNQEAQKKHLNRVRMANKGLANSNQEVKAILGRWETFVASLPGPRQTWTQGLLWRMALHLARATTVENGAICLHPVYGFAYLPGSGLKGLAHAYAELESDEPEKQVAIERIFGPPAEAKTKTSGSVVFLDAWPVSWPALDLDIVNVHHQEYYGSEGGAAPGDWESPVPSYFLAVAPGEKFRFAIIARGGYEDSKDDVELAAKWLQAALQEFGAGAKTAAGYGYFGDSETWSPRPLVAGPLGEFHGMLDEYERDGTPKSRRARLLTWLEDNLAQEPPLLREALTALSSLDPNIVHNPRFKELSGRVDQAE